MSKFYNGSICLSDIPKDKITTSEKNGKKYLNIIIWVNDEEKFGNIGSIQVSQSKDERDAKETKVYIGNFKEPKAVEQQQPSNGAESLSDLQDLPF